MILRRIGCKKRVAAKLLTMFPKHKIYIEPFFGAGGMFFNKPLAKLNFVNDLDDNVYNLYMIVKTRSKELYRAVEYMIQDNSLFKFWKNNQEDEPIQKALRFIMISNYSIFGAGNSYRGGNHNLKRIILEGMIKCKKILRHVEFYNKDCISFMKSIVERDKNESTFVYCDPPYLETDNNYSASFTDEKLRELVAELNSGNTKFAISEFDSEPVLKIASDFNLNINIVGERVNIKNRRTEILLTNYDVNPSRQIELF